VRSVSLAFLAAIVVPLNPACDLQQNASDLGSALTDPEAMSLDVPGRKLTDGRFRALAYATSDQSGGRILTLRDEGGESHLAITSFIDGTTCDAGPAELVRALSYDVDWTLPELVSCESAADERGRRTVHFVDLACQEQLRTLPQAEWVGGLFPSMSEPRGRLVLSEGQLLFLSFADRSLSVVRGDVSLARSITLGTGQVRHVWVVSGGRLVALSDELEVIAEFGQDVSYIDRNYGEPFVYSDARGVHAIHSTDEGFAETSIAPNGCHPVVIDLHHIAFLEPCNERGLRLWIAKPPVDLGTTDEWPITIELPGKAIQLEQVRIWDQWLDDEYDHLQVLYMTSDDPEAVSGDLWLGGYSKDQELLPARRLAQRATFTPNGAAMALDTVMVDWDGSVGRLLHRLYEKPFDENPFAEVAREVGYVDPLYALANYQDGLGDLLYFGNWSPHQPAVALGQGVPRQGISSSRTFVGNYDGSVGTLYALDYPEGVITAEPFIEKVVPDSYRVIEDHGLELYRAAPLSGGGATLHARVSESGVDLAVNGGVTEALEITWPTPGLLYLVDDGGESGIWFSAAR
jgi:hypothetical protein